MLLDPSFSKLAYGSKMVMGHGNLRADVAFVVEEPSPEDLHSDTYLCGKESPAFRHLLMCLDVSASDVYITSLAKWRPCNRKLSDAEATRLMKFLHKELLIVRPKIVVVLGRGAVRYLVPKFDLSRELGREVTGQRWKMFPMYHPSAALANADIRTAMLAAMSHVAVSF